MIRVASLYLPQLAIERVHRTERPAAPPERAPASLPLPYPVNDDPGACSVPRGGGWRPGARWAQDGAGSGVGMQDGREQIATGRAGRAATKAAIDAQIAELPAHQRPPMRMLGRRSESADHPFRAMSPDEGGGRAGAGPFATGLGGAALAQQPLVLIERVGQREIIASACPIALRLGLVRGMTAAHARALVGQLEMRDADPAGDRAWLDRLALHAIGHWTPSAAVSGLDGLWLDLTGTTHLFGGEGAFCRRLLRLLARLGISGRIAVAGTPGAAHALARYSGQALMLLPNGGEAEALAGLPVAALRLEASALSAAARFGFEQVIDLIRVPRGPLAKRLGLATVTRLDQALGQMPEPIVPVIPFETPAVTRRLLEPIGTAESIAQVIADLVGDLVVLLEARGLGARRVVLTAQRVDGAAQRAAVGASRATRDARHLRRMFALRIDKLEPGLGIEAMHLTVPVSEPLGAQAGGGLLAVDNGASGAGPDLAPAIDQLVGRAGSGAVFRIARRESDVPERAVRRADPLALSTGWPRWARPVRMLATPEPLSAVVALLPDHPPRRFSWRGVAYQVVAGDGPERIHGEWWRSDAEHWAVRDYFRVETESGERFWIFRRGDGVEPDTGDLCWHLHGLFG